MSIESAIKFIEDVNSSEEHLKRISGDKTATEVLTYARDNGYDFTLEELAKGKVEYGKQQGIELSEEDLDDVAGGTMLDPETTSAVYVFIK